MLNINLSFIRKYALGFVFVISLVPLCATLAVIPLIRCAMHVHGHDSLMVFLD